MADMAQEFDTQKLLLLRKLTRSVAEFLRGQLKDHLSALTPIIRPRTVLGDFVSGSTKESPNFADKAFQEVQQIYANAAANQPFQISKELKPPLEVTVSPLEITALEYEHVAQTPGESKTVMMTSPLKWVLSYPGLPLSRLREILRDRTQTDTVQRFVIHYSLLHFMLRRQPGFANILNALRFTVSSTTLPDFGNLPIALISAPISTHRPPDHVIIENTEISGVNVFEEVISVEDVDFIPDPFVEKLKQLIHGSGL